MCGMGHAWQGDRECTWQGHAWQGGHEWQGGMRGRWHACWGGMHGGGMHVVGGTATAADGTYPTGIHSYCL